MSCIYRDITLWLSTRYNDVANTCFCMALLIPSLITVEECYKALERDPFNPDLHFTLYQLLRTNYDKSKLHLEKAVEFDPDKYSFLYFAGGNLYYKKGDFSKAAEYLWKALKYNPSDRDVYSLLAEIYLRENKNNTAVKVLKKGLNFFPDYSLYYILMGSALLNNASIRMALECFSKILTLDKEFKKVALFKLGLCHLISGNYKCAIDAWNELIRSFPSEVRGYYSLGFIYDVLGDKDTSGEYFHKCLDLVSKEGRHILKEKIVKSER
ncbi:MAG TPA: DUF3808 domain-containing protein [Candidatus Eremiobacteraeota bacterium]|nr:MAG: photosystem I assembly protein Ycf3 [bacterium ADurb.Bin363]HPZ08429.1 DUF3808 domain-containing protein [Candidatus Eremiobacteraeota bacterium]